ncbi:hypothetical protein [Leifsonia sp. AG29]|uniref:hypothetical protein n=1 Tax=Leifsonia sp. AG29 TaxID=2598860 RepID=UPI00131B8E52|nr:hypothetical protein [Leifsonia sp. AG29]
MVVSFAMVMTASLAIGLTTEPALGGIAGTLVTVIAVTVAARCFRGTHEASGPRPWWKMTASRTGSIVLAGIFAIGGALNMITGSAGLVAGFASLLIAAACANSAVRLVSHDDG